jgi:transposase
METCAEAFRLADLALAAGHEVRVVPTTLVRALGVGARGTKTDVRDARIMSESACRMDLPSVHIPSALARDLRSRSTAREVMVSSRTKLVNSTRGWARQQGLMLPKRRTGQFPETVRTKALQQDVGLPLYVENLLCAIDTLNVELAQADAEMKTLAMEADICKRMMTTPGVGPITAVRMWAALDDCSRFRSAHAVEAYLGLTPGENSSSERIRRTGITKAGPAPVRRVLVQAAWVAMRTHPEQRMCQWALKIAERRGKRIAVVALARKLAGILYAIWRDGSTYDPKYDPRAAKTLAQPS